MRPHLPALEPWVRGRSAGVLIGLRRCQDGCQEAGEAADDVGFAEAGPAPAAFFALLNETGFAEYAEVVGVGGWGDVDGERRADLSSLRSGVATTVSRVGSASAWSTRVNTMSCRSEFNAGRSSLAS